MSREERQRYDAIVIGGGHNGLVCAAYLGRGGLRTLVLERRSTIGGAAATTELLPGVRVPTFAHTVGRLDAAIARELGLREHRLRLVQPAARLFAPHPDGGGLVLWGDADRTARELATVAPDDGPAYLAFDRRVRALAALVAVLARTAPPDLRSPNLGDALSGVRLATRYRRLAKADAHALLRVLPMPVGDLVSESFASESLAAAIALRGVLYSSLSPRSAGSAQLLLADSAGNDGGAAGQTVFARGGPGALADAVAAAARAAGAEIRTGSAVRSVLSDGERATGVVLESGESIEAGAVVSALDPKRTLLDLVDPELLGPTLGWRTGNLRAAGVTAKVNLALAGLPRFRDVPIGEEARLRGRIVIAPTLMAIERAQAAAKYGRLPAEPIIEATIPSLVDPSLVDPDRAGAARHVLSVLVQAAPYRLREGTWDERREELGDLVVRTLDAYAPGLAALVVARQVLTPLDVERELGVTGGHPYHLEPGLDQWFAWRPLLGHARYRLPVPGLYLCGAGAHPGGGVTGLPGRNAAREVLRDLRRQ